MTEEIKTPPRKVYVCECGYQSPAQPGFHWPGGPAIPEARLQATAGRICAGLSVTACYLCPNCGQWARPHRTATAIVWDCLNDCAARGFATFPTVRL